MPEEIQGWELFTVLTLRGEAEFRAKLADINRLVDDTQKKLGGLGGGVAGATGGVPGNFAPLGGGPRPGIPGNFAPPNLAPRDQVTFETLTGAGATPSEAFKAMGIRPPPPTRPPRVGGGGGPPFDPMRTWTAGGGLAGKGRPEGFVGDKTWTAGANLVGKGASDTETTPFARTWTAGGNLVGKGASDGMKELAKAAKDAAASTKQFGLHQMWVLRAASSGGIPGMAGGALGAAASLVPGVGLGLSAAALLGNFAGQMAGGFYERFAGKNAADVEMGSPGLAYQRRAAERDAQAAAGRNYRGTYQEGTALERFKADFHAGGGETPSGAVGNAIDQIGQGLQLVWYKMLATLEGVDAKRGAGVGLAPGPMAGRSFDSVADFSRAAIAASMVGSLGGGTAGQANFFRSSIGAGPAAGYEGVIHQIIANRLDSAIVR